MDGCCEMASTVSRYWGNRGASRVPQSEAPFEAICERFATRRVLASSIEEAMMCMRLASQAHDVYRVQTKQKEARRQHGQMQWARQGLTRYILIEN